MVKNTFLLSKVSLAIIILLVTCSLIVPSSSVFLNQYNEIQIESNDEIVWWNTTELDPEPYTAPFFEIYKLKDFGQDALGLATADFNNDNFLDFAVGWVTYPFDYTGVSIFYRDSDTSFKVEDIKQNKFGDRDLEAVDFDNDGDIDLMSARYDGEGIYSVNIYWNDNGIFERETHVEDFNENVGYWSNPHITTADFDLDGDVDFLVGANCGKVKLFKNDGTAFFSDEGVIFDYGDVSWGLNVGDFNKDGYPDFIVCAETNPSEYPFNDAGHIYLKLNDQNSSCFDTTAPGTLVTSIPLPFDYTIGASNFGSVAVLDYNDDGLLDVIYGGDWKIFLLIQQVEGSFEPFYAVGLRDREFTWSDRLRAGGFTVGDFNYDGFDDVVVGGVQGTVRLLINNQTFVNIVEPQDRLIYFFGNTEYSMRFPGMKLVIGDIDVVAKGLEPLSRVDFYLNDKLVFSDDSEPFVWSWTKFGFGEYQVAAEAYDKNNEFAGRDTFMIWKFL